jgi:hypothetical protein
VKGGENGAAFLEGFHVLFVVVRSAVFPALEQNVDGGANMYENRRFEIVRGFSPFHVPGPSFSPKG